MMPIKIKALLIRLCNGFLDRDGSGIPILSLLRILIPPMTPVKWSTKKGITDGDSPVIVNRIYGAQAKTPNHINIRPNRSFDICILSLATSA
jgi:hypothetical protein